VIVDEADVLRDEGETYAARLRAVGVEVTTVRYDGITHDFMMLNPLSNTRATRAAVAQAIAPSGCIAQRLREKTHSAAPLPEARRLEGSAMSSRFDLSSYDDVRAHAERIYERRSPP